MKFKIKEVAKVIDTGWIKLHRKIKEKGWYGDSEYVHLWIHLLLKANHNDAEFLSNGNIVKLKSGQFITGRKQLSMETGISESKIERVLKCFEKDGEIEQQTNSRNRLISIVSWDMMQKSEQQTNNKRTTNEQQMDTNNNEKNIKNEENIIYSHWIEEFIQTQTAEVKKMKTQMTLKEMEQIDNRFKTEWIKKKLEAMDNKPNLTKKYVKVSTTLKNWLEMEGSVTENDEYSRYAKLNEYNKGYHDKMFG